MLYLLLAIACSAGNALTMKFASTRSRNTWSLLLVNYVTCAAFGGALVAVHGIHVAQTPPTVLALGAVNGVLYVLAFALLQLNVRQNGATLSSSAARMGVLVPVCMSLALFGETPATAQIAGLIAALGALALLGFSSRGAGTGDRAAARLLLAPLVLAGGSADAMSKVFEVTSDDRWQLVFIGLTFLVALLVCAAFTLRSRERLCRADVACGVVLGVLNYLSSEFLLRAVLELPAFIAYTGASLGVIALVNVVNVTVMHEPLTRSDHLAMALIAVALVLLYLPLL